MAAAGGKELGWRCFPGVRLKREGENEKFREKGSHDGQLVNWFKIEYENQNFFYLHNLISGWNCQGHKTVANVETSIIISPTKFTNIQEPPMVKKIPPPEENCSIIGHTTQEVLPQI